FRWRASSSKTRVCDVERQRIATPVREGLEQGSRCARLPGPRRARLFHEVPAIAVLGGFEVIPKRIFMPGSLAAPLSIELGRPLASDFHASPDSPVAVVVREANVQAMASTDRFDHFFTVTCS